MVGIMVKMLAHILLFLMVELIIKSFFLNLLWQEEQYTGQQLMVQGPH